MSGAAKLAEEAHRGAEAKRLLETGVVKDALDKMEAELINVFRTTSPTDHEVIADAHKMLLLLERFKAFLRTAAYGGEFAAKELLRREGEKSGPS